MAVNNLALGNFVVLRNEFVHIQFICCPFSTNLYFLFKIIRKHNTSEFFSENTKIRILSGKHKKSEFFPENTKNRNSFLKRYLPYEIRFIFHAISFQKFEELDNKLLALFQRYRLFKLAIASLSNWSKELTK